MILRKVISCQRIHITVLVINHTVNGLATLSVDTLF